MKGYKYDSAHPARRCGHSYCTDCKTRRGRNRGNRRQRHAVRAALRVFAREILGGIVSYYLLELSYMGEKSPPRILDDRQLRTALGMDIESHHYSGDGNDIEFVGKYESGTLVPLTLQNTGEERGENDYLYWNYELTDPQGKPVLAFTVRIDGRA